MDLFSRLFIFLPMRENRKFSHKCTHPKHFRVSEIKISNVVTKETSQILLQTLCTGIQPNESCMVIHVMIQ